jgi:hypothetical protein
MQEINGYVNLDRITIVGTVSDPFEWLALVKTGYSMQKQINFIPVDAKEAQDAKKWRLSENDEVGEHAPYIETLPDYHHGTLDSTIKIRVDMNPMYQSSEMLEFVQVGILSRLENKQFTRVDFAFNTSFDLHLIDHNLSTTKGVWYGRDGQIETKQWGKRSSVRSVIVYDKAVEQGLDEQWWRYEIRLSGDMLRDWSQSVSDTINAICAPSDVTEMVLKVFANEKLSNKAKMNVLAYDLAGEQMFDLVSRPTKYQILKDVRYLQDEPDVIRELVRAFNQIWDNSTQSIAEQLQAYGNEQLEQLMRNNNK